MLPPELTLARRRGSELHLAPLAGRDRALALELGASVLATLRAGEGQSRDALGEAWSALGESVKERKLGAGLARVAEQAAAWEGEPPVDVVALRERLFLRAAELRRAGELDRDALLAEVGGSLGLSGAEAEAALYADLKGAERLLRAPALDPEALVDAWEQARLQGALLRAVRLEVVVAGSPAELRALLGRLKFRRLLFRVERAPEGHRLTIDGPFSLFEASTRYGLALGLALPALQACRAFRAEAALRWGAGREAVTLKLEGGTGAPAAPGSGEAGRGGDDAEGLPDEVRALLEALRRLEGDWAARVAERLVDVPGLGVLVPDLELTHRPSGARVLVEVLGHWSREAVFRRVDLVQRGVPDRWIFAVSERLRVSAEVLEGEPGAALHLYKGVINARALLRQATALL